MVALLIQVLEPLTTKWSPSGRAVVFSVDVSQPASGSVSAKHPMNSAAARRGSSRDFTSSEARGT